MKIYFRTPGGVEFYMERKPRPPLSSEQFYALVGLTAGAMVLTLLLAMVFV